MTQTYKQLLEKLLTLTPEQLDCTPTIYDSETDDYYPITTFLIATDEDQVLDEDHPYFSFSWWHKLLTTSSTEMNSNKT